MREPLIAADRSNGALDSRYQHARGRRSKLPNPIPEIPDEPNIIACLVAVGIVDCFEMVDIAHPHAQHIAMAYGTRTLLLQSFQNSPAVWQLCQWIVIGLMQKGFTAPNELILHFDHAAAHLDPGP